MRITEIPTSLTHGIKWRLMGCFTFQSFYLLPKWWEVEWSLEPDWIWWSGKVGGPAWNRASEISRSCLSLTCLYRVTHTHTRAVHRSNICQ